MARRSKRRVAFQGGPHIWPSEVASLPLEHEGVHRYEDLIGILDAPRVVSPFGGMGGTPIYARKRVRIWLNPGRASKHQLLPSAVARNWNTRRILKRADKAAFMKLPSLGKRTARCVGRIVRKQVMFALGKAGVRGIGRGKRWRRNSWSLYPC